MTRQEAIIQARSRLGLSEIPPSDWSYAQRIEYNQTLASIIADNADSFPPTEVQTARSIAAKTSDPLADNSLLDDLSVFGSAFAEEVEKTVDSAADVGRGVRDSVSIIGNALPLVTVLAIIGVVLYVAVKYNPRKTQ